MDLIGEQDATQLTEKDKTILDPPMKIDTASGKTSVDFKVECQCKPLNQTVTPLVMAAGTPNVVSAGLRCVEEGYGFWRAP